MKDMQQCWSSHGHAWPVVYACTVHGMQDMLTVILYGRQCKLPQTPFNCIQTCVVVIILLLIYQAVLHATMRPTMELPCMHAHIWFLYIHCHMDVCSKYNDKLTLQYIIFPFNFMYQMFWHAAYCYLCQQ